jgi:MFS family permease
MDADWRTAGCWMDSMARRELSEEAHKLNDMTVEKCITYCREKGTKYAGLQVTLSRMTMTMMMMMMIMTMMMMMMMMMMTMTMMMMMMMMMMIMMMMTMTMMMMMMMMTMTMMMMMMMMMMMIGYLIMNVMIQSKSTADGEFAAGSEINISRDKTNILTL